MYINLLLKCELYKRETLTFFIQNILFFNKREENEHNVQNKRIFNYVDLQILIAFQCFCDK